MWIISTPLLAAQINPLPNNLSVLDLLALLVWFFGFFFETVGDWKLSHFKSNPANKGKVLDTGVWRYTRHPNYFGDATQWWAYYLIAAATRGGFWTIFSPLFMTMLLLSVSGVALLEKNLTETKPQYNTYIESTNAFIPWFARKKTINE